MRATLHAIAACLPIIALVWWWHAGSNKGWTKTSVQVWKIDEVTEISYPEAEERFVPGVDFLAGAIGVSVLLAGAGFLIRKRPSAVN